MKAYGQALQVETCGDRPARLIWRGRTYPVGAVLDEWRFGGRWWLGERSRSCFLVQAGALTAELQREDGPEGRWWLARLVD
ncbi:hypothetical protein DEIGR_200160 [Deinococcus grandis]|uniref:DUF6504 domain-containing protein n=1 Tax=Deinococcus grandis TaxID=57498 RepID=A0A100HM74_9DEIO|nr:DUF6504 family protein [Deinococcus grandis]BBN96727.1 hypothetical protein DEGR_34600 [Deinococcus grandis]GAQ23305.1 hypothetical protein DEIGR_200160 [Deinococcus grandis]